MNLEPIIITEILLFAYCPDNVIVSIPSPKNLSNFLKFPVYPLYIYYYSLSKNYKKNFFPGKFL